MKKYSLLILLVLITVIAGCSVGNELIKDNAVISQIKPNVSTSKDVKKLLGEPNPSDISIKNDDETWRYDYGSGCCCLGSGEFYAVKITFSPNGVVKDIKKMGRGYSQFKD